MSEFINKALGRHTGAAPFSTPDRWVDDSTEPLDISTYEFDEWLRLFTGCLSKKIVMEGDSLNSPPGVPAGWREWIPAADTDLSLLLKPQINGLWVVITGTSEPDATEVENWKACIHLAASEIGKKHYDFHWYGLIGPAPSTLESGNQRLSAPTSIAHLSLSEATFRHVEYRPSQQPNLSSSSVFESWPVEVKGAARGYEWRSAERRASEELVMLCSLITLALDRAWTIPGAPQETPQPVPEFSPWSLTNIESTVGGEPQDLTLPDWVEPAWGALDSNVSLKNALGAYYQGMRMQDDFPSFACVSFVAAIETLGATKAPLERCKCCPDCKMRVGYRKQFLAGLQIGATEEEYDQLARAYGLRSETARAGVTHGYEHLGGWFHFPGLLWPEEDQRFLYDLFSLRSVSRRLIEEELKKAIETTTQS